MYTNTYLILDEMKFDHLERKQMKNHCLKWIGGGTNGIRTGHNRLNLSGQSAMHFVMSFSPYTLWGNDSITFLTGKRLAEPTSALYSLDNEPNTPILPHRKPVHYYIR